MAIRPLKARKEKQAQLALFGAFLLGAAVLGIQAASHLLADHTEYDETTLCAVGTAPAEHVAVLVDHTDPYSPIQRKIFAETIREVSASLAVGGRISVHVLSDQPGQVSVPVFDMCKPSDGTDANPIYENEVLDRMRYDQAFAGPMDTLAERLKAGASAETSPILEAAAEAALSVRRDAPLRLVIISDLLQNSALGSVYAGSNNAAKLEAAPGFLAIRRGLDGTRVDIVLLPSASHAYLQTEALTAFWRDALTLSGATVLNGLGSPDPARR
ncbi:hypothetical protein [Hyphomonas sp.]|uniref:hypothetical protein n=1 Tax=Hyphomonas sp. TaxID=87 RepID=UPI0025C34294|nr:hypothetical protein [Hyphomonas sp.]